jgi:hypothetical protein
MALPLSLPGVGPPRLETGTEAMPSGADYGDIREASPDAAGGGPEDGHALVGLALGTRGQPAHHLGLDVHLLGPVRDLHPRGHVAEGLQAGHLGPGRGGVAAHGRPHPAGKGVDGLRSWLVYFLSAGSKFAESTRA